MSKGRDGRSLINKVPVYKQKWRVSKEDIQTISTLLGQRWWEMFARNIWLHEEVEEIKRSYPTFDQQRYQLMLQWNNRFESKATYEIILNALSQLKQIHALDIVCRLLLTQKPGQPLLSALERYSDTLKRKYSEYKLKKIVDWPPPPAETVVKLAMIEISEIDQEIIGDMRQGNVQKVLKTKTVIEPDQLYEMIESGEGKVFLLEGAPGSGKSTMCWYICKQWGEGKLFQGFSHVIMVELWDKNIQAAKCLADMLPYCEAEDTRVAEELKTKKGKNVLVILEGWNELPRHVRKESILKELVAKGSHSPLQNTVVLVSSRSNTTVNLHKYTAARIEVLGFTPEQIEEYVIRCFESKAEPHKAQTLLEKINHNPKIKENCYLPLMLIIIVHLYDCSKTLPESFCQIIIELALSCLYRYCNKHGIVDLEDEMHSLNDLPSEIKPSFDHLCELAYQTTLKKAYSFSDQEMDGLGLLQNVRSIAVRGSEVTQYFLHSSLQELCAALHVARQPAPEQRKMLEILLNAPQDYVVRFYSALTGWKDESLHDILGKCSKENNLKIAKLIPPIPAKQDYHLQDMFMSSMKFLNTIVNLGIFFKSRDRESLNLDELLTHISACKFRLDIVTQKRHIEEIMHYKCYIEEFMKRKYDPQGTPDPELVNIGIKLVQSLIMNITGLQSTIFAEVYYGQFLQIMRPIVSTLYEKIKESHCGNYDELMRKLLEPEGTSNTLKQFWQLMNNFRQTTSSDFPQLFLLSKETIHTCMLLHCIYEAQNPLLAPLLGPTLVLIKNMENNDLLALKNVFQMKKEGEFTDNIKTLHLIISSQSDKNALTEVIKAGTNIRELFLYIEHYDDNLVEQVLNASAVERFRYGWIIPNNQVRINSCQSFCRCLKNNQRLRVLDLSGVPILDDGAEALAKVLNTTQIVELHLSRCGILEEGIIELAKTLKDNYCLTSLHLNEMTISPSALKSLSCCLLHNNTLRVIEMVEEPLISDLSKENLQEFVVTLCFNSSLTCLMLNRQYIHAPSMQKALTLVNITRKLKQQPLLSIDDHFPKNYGPELCNEFGMRPWEIRMKLLSINCTTETVNKTCILMEELAAQEPFSTQKWQQTLFCTQQFIHQSKAVRNMCVNKLLGASKKIYIRFRIQQHCIRECPITNSIMCRENEINLQREFEDHVHNTECMIILLSVITTMADVDTRPLQCCPPTDANRENPQIFLCKDHIKKFISQNSYCTDSKSLLHGTAFSIVLPYVLHHISTLLS